MSKTMTPETIADEAINYEEAINQMLAEMKRANERMERDQQEIDRLKEHTGETLARLKAM